jgi:hypothetical protein
MTLKFCAEHATHAHIEFHRTSYLLLTPKTKKTALDALSTVFLANLNWTTSKLRPPHKLFDCA